jgi:tetratricopeptide (TPR) repeat protein
MNIVARLLALNLMLATPVFATPDNALPDTAFASLQYADETDASIRELIQQSASITYTEPAKARPITVAALALAAQGKPIAVYDHAYALYLLLKNCYDGPGSSTFGPGTREDYVRVARRLIDLLDERGHVGQWVFTPEGHFYLDAYVVAAGGLAWYQYEDAKGDEASLEEALKLARKATDLVQDQSQYSAYDTEVRILLALKREDEAWPIVRKVLAETPDFADFHDLLVDPRYRAWRTKQTDGSE